jgi:hypothetical protein
MQIASDNQPTHTDETDDIATVYAQNNVRIKVNSINTR